MKRLFSILIVVAVSWPLEASGQSPSWKVSTHFQAGLYTPTRDLGTRGVAQARMRKAPAMAASLTLRRAGSPLGFYVASTQALRGGFRVWPTAECQSRCQALSVYHGRFWTFTGGVTGAWEIGPTQVTASVGGGLRSYAMYGRMMVDMAPQPGEFSTAAFGRPSIDPAFHVGLHLGRRVGPHAVFVGVEDFVAGSKYDRTFHDLVISARVHIGWPSSQ